jgi:hypothetical protein
MRLILSFTRRFVLVEQAEARRLVAGLRNGLGQFAGPLAALLPVAGDGKARAGLLRGLANQLDLLGRVGVEVVEADHGGTRLFWTVSRCATRLSSPRATSPGFGSV